MHTIYVSNLTNPNSYWQTLLKNDLSMVGAWICKLNLSQWQFSAITLEFQICAYMLLRVQTQYRGRRKVKTYRAQEWLQWLLSTYELSFFAWIIATILTEICSACLKIKQKATIFNCKWANSWAVSVCFAAKLLQNSWWPFFKLTYQPFYEKSSSQSNTKLDSYGLR